MWHFSPTGGVVSSRPPESCRY